MCKWFFTLGQRAMKDYIRQQSLLLQLCSLQRADGPSSVDPGESDSKQTEVGFHPAESFC